MQKNKQITSLTNKQANGKNATNKQLNATNDQIKKRTNTDT